MIIGYPQIGWPREGIMVTRPRNVSILISIGAISAVGLSLRMLPLRKSELGWAIGGCLIFISTILCAWGMWHMRRWALRLSWLIAIVIFVAGCFGVRFAWGFWLFKEPRLAERIMAVLDLQISLTVIFPIIWLFYFTQQRVKALFS